MKISKGALMVAAQLDDMGKRFFRLLMDVCQERALIASVIELIDRMINTKLPKGESEVLPGVDQKDLLKIDGFWNSAWLMNLLVGHIVVHTARQLAQALDEDPDGDYMGMLGPIVIPRMHAYSRSVTPKVIKLASKKFGKQMPNKRDIERVRDVIEENVQRKMLVDAMEEHDVETQAKASVNRLRQTLH